MDKRTYLRYAIAAAFALASGTSNLAVAVDPEPNHPITQAQPITISSDGTAEIKGVLGTEFLSDSLVPDLDFFKFEASAGDVLDIDIDGGIKPQTSATADPFTTPRSVDTILAIYYREDSGNYKIDAMIRDAQVDPGSVPQPNSSITRDARIFPYRVKNSGTHVVGVSSFPREFRGDNGAVIFPTTLSSQSNGSYILRISGVTPQVQQINIMIKPGSDEYAPINPKAKGNIPVAILSSAATSSSPKFDALEAVDRQSLTFGHSGDEYSLLRCGKEGTDVNGDNLPDLVCHFENQMTKLQPDDTKAVLKGRTKAGRPFEGYGMVRSVGTGKQAD